MYKPLLDVVKGDIKSASDAELLRIYRWTLRLNRKGALDGRLKRIIAEIKQRNHHIFKSA